MRTAFGTIGISLFLILALASCSTTQPGATPAGGVPGAVERAIDCPVKFVVSLTADLQGNIWAGTEDQGVFRFTPQAKGGGTWTQFSVIDGLGDDHAYAVACDRLGRIWVGHLNHGVSVYNGKTWRNYSVLANAATGTVAGPLGIRVFAIATNPRDGDVWIATEAGLSRYSQQHDSWMYYTRAQGLPSDQASSLAFDAQGNIFAGTPCDGIAMGASNDDYKKWTVIAGRRCTPPTDSGTGLPSDQINRVLVASDGSIYAGTASGLAWSTDAGATWKYLRGRDYADKIKGLYVGPPCDWVAPTEAQRAGLMAEDYISDLAEDGAGNIWIAHRQQGYEMFDPKTHRPMPDASQKPARRKDDYVTALLTAPHSPIIIGRYGDGLAEVGTARVSDVATLPAALFPALPLAAAPPTLQEIQAMLVAPTGPHSPPAKAGSVVALPDDWQTQGDWLGRYGRYWACICGILSPENYVWGAGTVPYSYAMPSGWATVPATGATSSRPVATTGPRALGITLDNRPISYSARLGPHHEPGDSMRYWIHWLYTTNHSTLEIPPTYLHSRVVQHLSSWQLDRREAEINDHGEPYPRTAEGPDLYFLIRVPQGQFVLSLYDFNKDGHAATCRRRDNIISIRKHGNNYLFDIDDFIHQPELARTRVRNFWGGVYKKFLVQGPIELTIKLDRNYSYDTILSGVFLDRVDEKPDPYFTVPTPGSADHPGKTATLPAQILAQLDELRTTRPAVWATQSRLAYVQLARWTSATNPQPDLTPDEIARTLGTCLYHLCYFDGWEHYQQAQGLTTARQIEKNLRWDLKTESFEGLEHQLILDARQGIQKPTPAAAHAADDYDIPANAQVRDCTKGPFATPCKEYRNQAGELVGLEKFDRGYIVERELYKDGKPHGVWTTYSTAAFDATAEGPTGLGAWPTYKPGQLVSATPYVYGVMHGYVDRFDDRGELVCHSWIDHGNGVITEYYPNGHIREKPSTKPESRMATG